MMSNYPPGVSGNEYEISGPTYEETEHKECDNGDAQYVPEQMVRDYVATAVERLIVAEMHEPDLGVTAAKALTLVKADLNELIMAITGEGTTADCGFEGDVDVQGYRDQKWWTCPRCGIEHTEDVDYERDEDQGSDR